MLANLFQKLKKKYRIAFIDNESLHQYRMLIIRPLSILISFFVVLLLVAIGTAFLVIFSPINQMIPGAPNPEMDEKFLKLTEALDSAEVKLRAKDEWIVIMQQAASSGVDLNNHPPVQNHPEIKSLEQIATENIVTPPNGSPESLPAAVSSPQEPAPTPLEESQFNLLSPVNGYVSSKFSYKEDHFGVDIVARENTPIKSIASGYVIFSEYSDETGYVIGISHGQDLFTFYKHNSTVFKKVGDYVFGGEAIAVIGNSGQHSSGTHLHFELWHKGQARNPMDYITFN